MSDEITIELIRAAAAIMPTAAAIYAAMMAARAANTSTSTAKKMDGLLDARVQAATDLGHAEGKAAGVTEERDRT